jgi:1-acyl-sn-glycerol-3-phosphate acyltransferase
MIDEPKPLSESIPRLHRRWGRIVKDAVITVLLWGYFTAGFLFLFAPFYLLALIFAKDRRSAFQGLNSLFYRGFFLLCRLLIPRHRWEIHPSVRTIRSAVVICNHISYLDSILLVSLYSRHTTIAKDRLFAIPIFGDVLKLSGYLPSSGRGRYADLLLDSLNAISASLEKGGNVIVFPEGTRSRDGHVGRLHKGVFKIAKYCKAPIKVLAITNTEKLFPPGKFLFNTCIDNVIGLKMVAEFLPEYDSGPSVLSDLTADVEALLDKAANPVNFNPSCEETLT